MHFTVRADMDAAIEAILPETVLLRRALHRHPEIRFQERWTSDRIAAELSRSGITVKRGYCGGTGLVGETGGNPERVIALRADMDGLEIQEETGVDYASEIPKRMHACGHDGHMAMLCGAARILAQRAAALDCTVRFIFQPGEELGMGGRVMVEEGVLNGVEAVFCLHGWPSIALGRVGLKSGVAMAAADWFQITIRGKGCHGADPSSGVNPIVVAAQVVTGLQTLGDAASELGGPTVISVGRIHGGEAKNIIPETTVIAGSLRTLSSETRDKARAAIQNIAADIADRFGAAAVTVFDEKAYMPLYNDPAMCDRARRAINADIAEQIVLEMDAPSMASEDFAYYLERVPGAILWLGTGRADGDTPPLHSPRYDFNDDALATGIGVWLRLVQGFAQRWNV